LKRLYRWLRSPKLALVLILGVGAYSIVGTLVPQPYASAKDIAQWVAAHQVWASIARPLGLFHAFTSPVFLAAIALLAASTIACAIARTSSARTRFSAVPDVEALRRRVVASGDGVDLAGASGVSDEEVLASIAETFREDGYRITRLGPVLEARRNLWGAFGSPVFHWALAALMVLGAAGAATRAEGSLDLPIGTGVIDRAESYGGKVSKGPLFLGHSGLELKARDFELTTMANGLDRGHSAVVDLFRNGRLVASRRVYPNSPLRYGRLLIHRTALWGYAPVLRISAPGLQSVESYAYLPVSAITSAGVGPVELSYPGRDGRTYLLSIEIPGSGTDAAGATILERALLVSVNPQGSSAAAKPARIVEGGSTQLPDGTKLTFARRGYFMNVSVADDWAVPFIYAAFVIAGIGLAVALFSSPRRAWIVFDRAEDGGRVHVLARSYRGDPGFSEHAVGIVRDALAK
jgi:cytochrome c biogenesis protein